MSRWFRFYSEAMRSPKVASLSDRDFRLWMNLLAVAAENEGKLPPANDLKHLLKSRLDHLLTGLDRLISIGLIDRLDNGYEPHNWSKFQYKSDTSSDRVAKYRGKRNVSETAPEAETDTEPPTPPKGGQRNRPKGAMIFKSKAKELGGGNERTGSHQGVGVDRGDVGRLPGHAVGHQRDDGGLIPARRVELLDYGA